MVGGKIKEDSKKEGWRQEHVSLTPKTEHIIRILTGRECLAPCHCMLKNFGAEEQSLDSVSSLQACRPEDSGKSPQRLDPKCDEVDVLNRVGKEP